MKSGKEHDGISNLETLSKREHSILTDVLLYRLTTNGIVRARHLQAVSANAVTKVTARLVREKWLQSHVLFDKQVYFTPGKNCLKQYGLPVSRMLPLGTQALAMHLSIASYCSDPAKQYQLISPSHFAKLWSWIPKKLQVLPHVILKSEDRLQVRTLRVDLGGTPEHVATKCNRDINLRINIPGYVELRASRCLIHVVLTSTESKKQAIMHALQRGSWPSNTRFEVSVIPELCRLLSH